MVDQIQITSLFQDAIGIAVRISAPILLLCMLVGIVIAIFQAVTQIHEQSLSFLLKLIVVILCLTAGGSWMMQTIQDFTRRVFAMM